jgi:bifunctional DNA-binding transcriptional regulator/antitoxin component of YhaV-PrlF toxin-antitoxin module
MKYILTVSGKGQITLPPLIRRKLGLNQSGGKLLVSFDEPKNEIIVSRLIGIAEMNEKLNKYIPSNKKPMVDVDTYYQTNRRVRF